MGFQPDQGLWMLSRGAQMRFNSDGDELDPWSKPVIPITNGYGYLDLAWDPQGALWASGGSGTLLVSRDGGASWNAIAVSLIASCRLHDIEPWAYLRDVLTLLPAWNHIRAIELAPAYWQQTREQPKTLELLQQRQLMGRGAQHQQQDAVG
jgi:hypothetical protein